MSRFVVSAVLLGLTAAGFWYWLDDSGQASGGDAMPAAFDQGARPPAVEMLPSGPASSIQAAPARQAPAPAAAVAPQPAALPASDPFRSFLQAQRAASAPIPPVQQNQAEIRDAFRAALEESARRRAAESKSPFGEAKP